MDTLQTETRAKGPELTLLLSDTLLDQPLWRSLIQNAEEVVFRKRLPPLVLTSTPLPVKDIWGFYDYKTTGVLGSTVVHLMALVAVIGLTILGRRVVMQTPQATVTLLAPDDLLLLRPSRTRGGGGGGGGDRDKLRVSKGRLPKLAMQQLTPPTVVVRNDNRRLTVEPTVVIPLQIVLATNQLPTLGDPMSQLLSAPPSNGTGSSGGIGSGNGGFVGSGEGPGVGPGRGGGVGGGVFRIGGGVSAPRPVFRPGPEYSEEARKAKYQGTCVLWMVVGPDGKTRDIKVARTLGLGLDEKAIEAVKQWKFEPAMKEGTPVAVQVNVEVTFRLY
ncbi:MAG TPA: energy transducer TonB [Terriglobales bacterium]|nr:energy transducer TonB [Terriglobales bacterium]